jgi:hypothetical protein
MPMVRMRTPIGPFLVTKTCSTVAQAFDLVAFARARLTGNSLPFGLLRWMRETRSGLLIELPARAAKKETLHRNAHLNHQLPDALAIFEPRRKQHIAEDRQELAGLLGHRLGAEEQPGRAGR